MQVVKAVHGGGTQGTVKPLSARSSHMVGWLNLRNIWRISLQTGHKLRDAHLKCPGEHFKIADADFLLAVFQVRYEAAVHADVLGHVDLCPALPLSQRAQSLPESGADISGHAPIMAVGFGR